MERGQKVASLLLEVAIEANKARQEEDGVVFLLLNLRAPVPCRRQAAVDARASVHEVVGTTAIETMTEEVGENSLLASLSVAPGRLNELFGVVLNHEVVDGLNRAHNRDQDAAPSHQYNAWKLGMMRRSKVVPRNLRIFVNEHESIGDVVIAHVNYGGTHPGAHALLHRADDCHRGTVALRRMLHAIQP